MVHNTSDNMSRALTGDTAVWRPMLRADWELNGYESTDPIEIVREGFESNSSPLTFHSGDNSNLPWERTGRHAHTGLWSIRSGPILHDQESEVVVQVPAGAETISFWYRVSSEEDFDFLLIGRDGGDPDIAASGEVDWTLGQLSVVGISSVSFLYFKDGATVGGEDAAWVDDIVFTRAATVDADLDDLTDQHGQLMVDHNLYDGTPDEVAFISGSGTPSLSAMMAGRWVEEQGRELNQTQYFSPFQRQSPLFELPRDVAPVAADLEVVTEAGVEQAELFNGTMQDVKVTRSSAALRAVSATQLALQQLVQPPLIPAEAFGWGETSELLTGTWLASWILHRCRLASSPPPVPGCVQWVPFHGGYWDFLQDRGADLQEPLAFSGTPRLSGHSQFFSTDAEAWRQTLPRWVRGPYVAGLTAYIGEEAARYAGTTLADSFSVPLSSAPGNTLAVVDPDPPLSWLQTNPKWLRTDESAGRLQFYIRGDEATWDNTSPSVCAQAITAFGVSAAPPFQGVNNEMILAGLTGRQTTTIRTLILPGVSGRYAAAPDTAGLSITGNIDIAMDLSMNDWTPSATAALVGKWEDSAGRSYLLQVNTSGQLSLSWSVDGSAVLTSTCTTPVSFVNHQRGCVRVTLDVDDGGGNRVVTFYESADRPLTTPRLADEVAWVQLGQNVVAGTTSIFNSTAELGVGGHSNGTTNTWAGRVYHLLIRSVIDSTDSLTFATSADFTVFGAAASYSVFDTVNLWTVYGGGLTVPGTSGNYASTPDVSALDITGDLDIRCEATLTNWNSGAAQILAGKWDSGSNNRSYRLLIGSTGLLTFQWSVAGSVTITRNTTAVPPVVNGKRAALRATIDVDNGAAANIVTFYIGSSINGPWTTLASVNSGAATSIHSGTAPMEVGSSDGGTATLATGLIHAAQVRNGIDSTIVAYPRFYEEDTGATSFEDSALRTWTVNGTASITSSQDLVSGFDLDGTVGWWIDAADRKLRLRFASRDGTAYTVTSTSALPTDGQWHFVGFAWSIGQSRLAVNLDGEIDTLTDAGINAALLLPPWPGPRTSVISDNGLQMFWTSYLPVSESQFSTGEENADPVLNPVWMRDMEWDRKAYVYPSSLRIAVLAVREARQALEILQSMAEAETGTLTIDEHDVFHYRPPGWYATQDQQVVTEEINTDRHAQTPEVRLDPTRVRNIVQATWRRPLEHPAIFLDDPNAFTGFKETLPALALLTEVTIPPGVSVFRFTYSATPVSPPSLGDVPEMPTSNTIISDSYTLGWIANLVMTVNTAPGASGTMLGPGQGILARVTASLPNHFELTFTNERGVDVYLTNEWQFIDGSPVPYLFVGGGTSFTESSDTVIQSSAASIAVRGPRGLVYNIPWVGFESVANRLARRTVGQLARPIAVVDRLELFGDPRRQVGDLVRVSDPDETGMDELLRHYQLVHSVDGAAYTQTAKLQGVKRTGRWGDGVSKWGRCLWVGQENPGIYGEEGS